MDPVVKKYILSLNFGEPQEFKNMTVFPLLSPHDGVPDYMTLKEALEKALLVVTEVSSGGSVPELKVTNKADISVLLLLCFVYGLEHANAQRRSFLYKVLPPLFVKCAKHA